MQSIIHTMTEAFQFIQNTEQPLSFEVTCIQNFFVLPSRINAFHDDELFLTFIRYLVQERHNYSFPETAEDYDRYFSNCIQLKEQMHPFSKDTWLSCIGRLFENIKTPFYDTLANCILNLEPCFSNRNLFLQIIQDFYSVLIKSSPDQHCLIDQIAKTAISYSACMKNNEELLVSVLRYHLSCFSAAKNIWLLKLFEEMYGETSCSLEDIHIKELLTDFQKKEISFLSSIDLSDSLTFPEYLSRRIYFFSEHKTAIPENILTSSRRNSHFSVLSEDSILNKYAYNMTSSLYITNPAIGREEEISDLALILVSPKKSPILLGEAGVGKTAIVEGLAWRLQRGNVPKLLQNKEIYKLTTTSLLSGTKYVGEMEDRIRQLMHELSLHPNILLFIDEIHTIVGAGSTESSNNDISNMLKPFIDRGEIKIIGSTTSEEYTKYLLQDKALTRRFYPITIEEPDKTKTLDILLGTIESIEHETNVKNTFSEEETCQLLKILIDLSSREYQPEERRTRRPELPLTLLEMAFSYAALASRDYITKDDFINAVRHSNLLKTEIKQRAKEFF